MSLVFLMSEHFKGLMFDCHKQHAVPMLRQSPKASVHTSVNAARRSACATLYFRSESASTEYDVAASIMKRPTSDAGSRCLFNE